MAHRQQILLPSAIRAATTDTVGIVAEPDACGVYFYINETVQPGAETLQAVLQTQDPVSGSWGDLAAYSVTGTPGLYIRAFGLFPATAGFPAQCEVKQGVLPDLFRLHILHSGAGNHTYSVAAVQTS